MQANHGQIQIPLPTITDDARWIGRFSREVRKSIAALRDRSIVITGGQIRFSGGASYTPWKPTFSKTGIDPSIVYKCRFNLGTLNNVCASNWDTDHTLPSDGSVKFVMLQVTTASGSVTGLEIQLSSTAPASDTVLESTPPPVFKILLGVVDKSTAKMIVFDNLNASASEVFRQSRTTTTPGEEPFSRFWRWAYSAV